MERSLTDEDKSSPVVAAEDNMPVRKAVLARKTSKDIIADSSDKCWG